MIHLLSLLIKGGFLSVAAFGQIHSVKMRPDQILVVHTAVGIATILETPESIQSAIIGDQSGFKIEYIDHAVTIKPLRSGARTNLYLQTSQRRYDLRLETTRQETADYIVYLKTGDSPTGLVWHDFSKLVSGKTLSLHCDKIARLPQGQFLLDLKMTSKVKDKVSPENIYAKQGNDSKVINGIFLSRTDLSKDHPAMLGLTFLKSDLVKEKPLQVLVKSQHETLSLVIPEDVLWK